MPNLLPFLSFVFITAFTPGPNNIMAMANASRDGYKKTQKFILGVFSGFVIIMLLCSYFNLFLYDIVPKVKTVMSLAGALYIVYLAYKIAFGKPLESGSRNMGINSFFSGFSLQFINIKAMLYGITAISSFVIPYYKTNINLILFSLFLAFLGYLGTSCWAAFGSLFQKFLLKHEKPLNIFMGLLLVYCAVSLVIK